MIELCIAKYSKNIYHEGNYKEVAISAIDSRIDKLLVPEDDTVENFCRFVLQNDNKGRQLSNVPTEFEAYLLIEGKRDMKVEKNRNNEYLYNVHIIYTNIADES